jgi:hypothetical protein
MIFKALEYYEKVKLIWFPYTEKDFYASETAKNKATPFSWSGSKADGYG